MAKQQSYLDTGVFAIADDDFVAIWVATDIVDQLKLASVSAGGAPAEDWRAICLETVHARVSVAI